MKRVYLNWRRKNKERQRKQKVKKYLQKRHKIRLRTGKEIRYECRKNNSLKRKRIMGKFA